MGMPMRSCDFDASERAAVYRAIGARRDVRRDFIADEVEPEVVQRVLEAAHHAPSVGLSQPWRFIVTRDRATRAAVHAAFLEANAAAGRIYADEDAARYSLLRLEGILDAPLGVCVVCDEHPERGRGLGRQTMPETVRCTRPSARSKICGWQRASKAWGLDG